MTKPIYVTTQPSPTIQAKMGTETSALDLPRATHVLLSCLAWLAGFAIPISTALQNISMVLCALCTLLIPSIRAQLLPALRTPLIRACLVLYLAFLIGTLWSTASAHDMYAMLIKLKVYLLAPFLFAFFFVHSWRNQLLLGFATAATLSVLLSIGCALSGITLLHGIPGDYMVFRTHTYHNTFAGFLACGLAAYWITQRIPPKWHWLTAITITLCVIDIFFFVQGRTGQFLFLVLGALLVLLWQGKKGMMFALVGTLVLAPTLYFGSHQLHKGIHNIQSDLASYQQGEVETSIGLRLLFYRTAATIISQAPIFGHGTGSYGQSYAQTTGYTDGPKANQNPHNDYLWFWIDLGFFGLCLLPLLLAATCKQAQQCMTAERWLGILLASAYGLSTLANSSFTDNITSLAYIFLCCALLAGQPSYRTAQS
ncbi:MAG: O-antigen ligase family protein [Ottowia sp.]|nr:O-antigen ligase family protein [Ottowia sp.]